MKQLFILKEPKSIKNNRDIFKHIKKINIDYDQENLILIGLNNQMELIYKKILFKGGVNACVCEPSIIFRRLILNNCSFFMLVHNHPSNNLKPSKADIETTSKILKCGQFMNLKLIDAIIFNPKEYYSFIHLL